MASCLISIYGLEHEGEVWYIGQTSLALKTRLSIHLATGRRGHTLKGRAPSAVVRWLAGVQPSIILFEQVLEERAAVAEREWIEAGRALGWPLLNTDHQVFSPPRGPKRRRQTIPGQAERALDDLIKSTGGQYGS